jgi:hypothetical protein
MRTARGPPAFKREELPEITPSFMIQVHIPLHILLEGTP